MLSKSYIINNYKVSKTVHDFVHGKLQGCSPAERRFFLHVLCSGLITRGRAAQKNNLTGWDDFSVSLPYQTIRAQFPRGFSWRPLKAKGLIQASEYHDGCCRYFQVTPSLFAEIAEVMDRAVMARTVRLLSISSTAWRTGSRAAFMARMRSRPRR